MRKALTRKNLWEKAPSLLKCTLGTGLGILPVKWLLGTGFRANCRLVHDAQWWPVKRARQYQLGKLREIFELAYESTEYYRRVFDSIGLHQAYIQTLDDLGRVPTIDKSVIIENLSDMCTKDVASGGVDYGATAGTSGSPVQFYMNTDRSATEYSYLVASWERAGYKLGVPMAVLRGRTVRADRKGFRHEYDAIFRHHYYSSFHLTDENMGRYLEHIATIGPCFLHVYPSSVAALARFILRNDACVPKNINGIIAESEIVYPEQRKMVEEVFGCRYFSCYGQSEKVVLAAGCEKSDDYHVWPTYGYFELLDADGNPVNTPGQRGEIVGTGFINTVMPFIRYRTGDWATYVGDRCEACGREHTIIRDIRGHRTQEVLIAADGSEIPWTALNMHDDTFLHVRQFQFRQETPGKAVLRIVAADGFGEGDCDRIHRNMGRKLDNRLAFTIELTETIGLSARGKAIYVDQQIQQEREVPLRSEGDIQEYLHNVMQTLDWYYRRLKVMSRAEVAWRVHSRRRDRIDRFLVRRRQRLRKLSAILNENGSGNRLGFRVSDMTVGDNARLNSNDKVEKRRCDSLLARAERIAEHRLDFFDLKDKFLGDPIVWNRDHKREQNIPLTYCASLDYRDVRKAGDCKFVWEPNRHHHLVVLARAYRLSGDTRFAKAVTEQLGSWLKQNPFGVGMNWRSGLELGIRLINWVWALDLIEESGAVGGHMQRRILDSAARHLWEIDRKYSRGSSVNNHLIGEAAGVFVAASYFRNLRNASQWRIRSREILCREILRQTFPDGGTVEQAIGYHLFVLQFFVIAGVTARAAGRDMPESYWSRLEKMFEFLSVLTEGGGGPPLFGDCDDGYVLDLGHDPRNVREWLSVGAALFDRKDFKARAGGCAEPVEWLLGKPGRQSLEAIRQTQNKKIASRALEKSGYYLLQNGELDSPDRISATFDCGPLGMEPLAGHGHADALSFTLRAFGRDVLVDPGTYDYFSYPKWREYFRSTRAHNTVVIDGRDQSEMLGPFLWGRRAEAKCLSWQPTNLGGKVIGEHDGYTCLKDPVTHRRMLNLDGRELVIRDDIIALKKHEIQIFFHLAEHCVVKPTGKNSFLVDAGAGMAVIELDPSLQVELFNGSEDPICGWVSRGYHQKKAGTTLVGRRTGKGKMCLVCRIDIGESRKASQ